MKVNFKKNNKGFNLIETLLVVGLIAIASIGVYKLFSKVQEGNTANTEAKNIDLIRAGVKSLYAAQTNYASLTPTIINRAKITPESMRVAGGAAIINSFGGAVDVRPAAINGGANNGFTISYDKVPGPVCTKLASGAAAQFDIVTVGGAAGSLAGNIKAFGVNNIDVAALTTACEDIAGTGVMMTFASL